MFRHQPNKLQWTGSIRFCFIYLTSGTKGKAAAAVHSDRQSTCGLCSALNSYLPQPSPADPTGEVSQDVQRLQDVGFQAERFQASPFNHFQLPSYASVRKLLGYMVIGTQSSAFSHAMVHFGWDDFRPLNEMPFSAAVPGRSYTLPSKAD